MAKFALPDMGGGEILGIIGTMLIFGLILKDASKFNTVVGSVNSTISTLGNLG